MSCAKAELDGLDEEAPVHEVEAAWNEEIARRVQSIKTATQFSTITMIVMRELEEIVKR